jgi:hypothetical protein
MQFELDYQKTYTETLTRVVGATERTGVRGTLPQPAPDNTNSIWLTADSLYGSDANPGTQASPKLTLNGAIAALGGAATTVHIFRPTGSTADIIFPETVVSTLGVTRFDGKQIDVIGHKQIKRSLYNR